LDRGEAIFAQNDRVEYWYEVVSGLVRTCHLNPDGRRQLTGFFFRGDVFGVELSVHRATAEAVTPAVVRRFRRPALQHLDVRSPGSAEATEMLGRALESAEDRILLLGLRTAAERLAGFILMMAARTEASAFVELPMCRSDIGDYLGLTSETVSRTFSEFVRRRLIAFEGPQRIRILAASRLMRLGGADEDEELSLPGPAARRAQARLEPWGTAPLRIA